MSALDTQIGGSHYKNLAIQPMEYSMANGLDACQHSVIKYVTRFRDKGGIADLEKAKHCIDMLIDFERRKEGIQEMCTKLKATEPKATEADRLRFSELHHKHFALNKQLTPDEHREYIGLMVKLDVSQRPIVDYCNSLGISDGEPKQRGWPYLPDTTDPLEAQAAIARSQI